MAAKRRKIRKSETTFVWLLFSLCLCVSAVNLSCNSKPTDLHTLVPAETLVYLETNDLAAALQPIVDNKAFEQVAKSKPDFSALKGVQLAVAVTGFETTEEKVTDENSIGRVQPHFVAVADTHAWNYQAVAFTEKKLGDFVANIYDSEPTLDKSDKNGGKYFTWTAKDGRKAYALVIDSLIYFANDESSIEKCLAVKRGEADSIIKTGKVQSASQETLASGYVSTDGIAQIANIVGLKFASEAGEDSGVQSAIAGILPQLLRNSITEISWTANKTDEGIEDKYLITMPPEVAGVFSETMIPGERIDPSLFTQLPPDVTTVTLYNLKDPQIAWRSLILVAQKQLDPLAGKIIAQFSSLFFEPYGIRDPELFLSASVKNLMGRGILTAKLEPESEDVVVIAVNGDNRIVMKSLDQELRPPLTYVEGGTNIWSTPDGERQVIFDTATIKIGSKQNLALCNEITALEVADIKNETLRGLAKTKSPVTTIGQDLESAAQIADVFLSKKGAEANIPAIYVTETRFTKTGIERRTVSDFGLIGSIIAQLAQD